MSEDSLKKILLDPKTLFPLCLFPAWLHEGTAFLPHWPSLSLSREALCGLATYLLGPNPPACPSFLLLSPQSIGEIVHTSFTFRMSF